MNTYINLFLKGAVASLPSIIAAVGILINNNRASARQKNDRNIKMKIDLLERIYGTFIDINDSYIDIMSSIEIRFYSIQEEILKSGTENNLQNYVLELNELAKKSVLFAVHKRKVLDLYKIKVDADELAHYIFDVTKEIVSYADAIAFITKLFVIKYYETADSELTTKAVVQELKNEVEKSKLYNQCKDALDVHIQYMDSPRRELIKDYTSILTTFDDIEKRKISSSISPVIKAYLDNLNKYDSEPIEEFEKQLVMALKKLVK